MESFDQLKGFDVDHSGESDENRKSYGYIFVEEMYADKNNNSSSNKNDNKNSHNNDNNNDDGKNNNNKDNDDDDQNNKNDNDDNKSNNNDNKTHPPQHQNGVVVENEKPSRTLDEMPQDAINCIFEKLW